MMLSRLAIIFGLVIAASASCSDFTDTSIVCGFILPHSHDDCGWLKTVPEYYADKVHDIISTAVSSLTANPSRRFIIVEQTYFSMWWRTSASADQQNQVRKLVANGQLEFVLGGWTMEDEACTTYSANVDQMTTGHQFLLDTFGVRPRFGWQIDPFGASTLVHQQFALMGFDATVVARIDYLTKEDLQNDGGMHFVWRTGGANSTAATDIFTHVLDIWRYSSAVDGLKWDDGDTPVWSGNIDKLSSEIADNLKLRSAWYSTKLVLFPWGDDFEHFKADMDFDNMDKLVDYINANSKKFGVEVRYATLADYFDALHSLNATYAVRGSEDFFAYADEPSNYWTGYFTSRVATKGYFRAQESVRRAAETLFASQQLGGVHRDAISDDVSTLEALRETAAIMTHHDAVTGTSEPQVVQWFAQVLGEAGAAAQPLMQQAISSLSGGATPANSYSMSASTMTKLAYDTSIALPVYNSLAWNVGAPVRVPVMCSNVAVSTGNNQTVLYEVRPSLPSNPTTCLAPGTCGYPDVPVAPFEVHFQADLPPLGYNTYFVAQTSSDCGKSLPDSKAKASVNNVAGAVITLENDVLSVSFDNATGSLLGIVHKPSGASVRLSQTFLRYPVETTGVASEGAYIFAPEGSPVPIAPGPISFEVHQGPYVQEVRQVFTAPCTGTPASTVCGVSQTIRIYTGDDQTTQSQVELLQDVGPLPERSDVVTRFMSSLATNGTFYTDNNCYLMQQRVYNASKSNKVAGNYYPVQCAAFIRDDSAGVQLSLLTDRAHGVTSLQDGQLELMVHRRSDTSDRRGPANDDGDRVENIRTLLVFGPSSSSTAVRLQAQYRQQNAPTVFYAPFSTSNKWPSKINGSAVGQALPESVHLLTFSLLSNNDTSLLLRVQHVFHDDDPNPLAVPVNVDLSGFFPFSVASLIETTLTANAAVGNITRLAWRTNDGGISRQAPRESQVTGTITLNPGEVRTFSFSIA